MGRTFLLLRFVSLFGIDTLAIWTVDVGRQLGQHLDISLAWGSILVVLNMAKLELTTGNSHVFVFACVCLFSLISLRLRMSTWEVTWTNIARCRYTMCEVAFLWYCHFGGAFRATNLEPTICESRVYLLRFVLLTFVRLHICRTIWQVNWRQISMWRHHVRRVEHKFVIPCAIFGFYDLVSLLVHLGGQVGAGEWRIARRSRLIASPGATLDL